MSTPPAGRIRRTSPSPGAKLFPTVLAAAGIEPSGDVRGRSLRPLLDGTSDAGAVGRDAIYGEMTHYDYYAPETSCRYR